MEAWQERVIAERQDLDVKIVKLSTFIGSPSFVALPGMDQRLLREQRGAMSEYSDILQQRIDRF